MNSPSKPKIDMEGCPYREEKSPWEDDWLGSASPSRMGPPYFDKKVDGWIFSRYADVIAALNCPDLVLISPTSKTKEILVDEDARLRMRSDTRAALSLTVLRAWRKQILDNSRDCLDSLDLTRPIDLIKDYAEPVCLAFALLVTNPKTGLDRLTPLAVHVSAAAAEPFDEVLKAQSKAASMELQRHFDTGPETLRESGFVALSRTMVHLLGNAWLALLFHPLEWDRLHRQPALVARAVEELLRFAGLTRLVYRQAIVDTNIDGVQIRRGDRLILRIFAANRDPDRFVNPNIVSVMRRGLSQVSLGAGRHVCVGGPVVRLAAMMTTYALLERFSSMTLIRSVEWQGGDGFKSPISLPILVPPQPYSTVIY